MELSVHACNFVLKLLDREEPGANVWTKSMLKLQPLYYYMINFCNLVGLEQWYFSLI